MYSLLEAAQRRRALEREQAMADGPSAIPEDTTLCPVCGGRSRSGVTGPCVACRADRVCECGCGRKLDPRDEWFYSKWCGPTALRALASVSSPEVSAVVRLLRPVIAAMRAQLEAEKADQAAADARQLGLFNDRLPDRL